MTVKLDAEFMRLALQLAGRAANENEIPIGAVLVKEQQVIASAYNQTVTLNDPTAHAEILAIRAAAKQCCNSRLPGTTLYVTVEPCCMCVGALVHARIEKLVFGAREPRSGAVLSVFELLMSPQHNHRVAIREGVMADQCAAVMRSFFNSRR